VGASAFQLFLAAASGAAELVKNSKAGAARAAPAFFPENLRKTIFVPQ